MAKLTKYDADRLVNKLNLLISSIDNIDTFRANCSGVEDLNYVRQPTEDGTVYEIIILFLSNGENQKIAITYAFDNCGTRLAALNCSRFINNDVIKEDYIRLSHEEDRHCFESALILLDTDNFFNKAKYATELYDIIYNEKAIAKKEAEEKEYQEKHTYSGFDIIVMGILGLPCLIFGLLGIYELIKVCGGYGDVYTLVGYAILYGVPAALMKGYLKLRGKE